MNEFLLFFGGYALGMIGGMSIVALNRCRLGLHRFGRWHYGVDSQKRAVGQQRFCQRCGRIQIKMFEGFTLTINADEPVKQ